ncbi:MAG: hypothetical protein R6V62_08955 [Candidatus Fermentibacteraceae bacterium]
MAKLSDLVKTIDETAKSGDRSRAVSMIDSLLPRLPADKAEGLQRRRQKLLAEIELDRRIAALEKQYGS